MDDVDTDHHPIRFQTGPMAGHAAQLPARYPPLTLYARPGDPLDLRLDRPTVDAGTWGGYVSVGYTPKLQATEYSYVGPADDPMLWQTRSADPHTGA